MLTFDLVHCIRARWTPQMGDTAIRVRLRQAAKKTRECQSVMGLFVSGPGHLMQKVWQTLNRARVTVSGAGN
jgi:hypothetical protein